MLNINGKQYVLKGGPEDNGSYNYFYYIDTVTTTYTITYNNYPATLIVSRTYYKDVDTNEVIHYDNYQYTIKQGSITKQGVCFNDNELLELLDQLGADEGRDTPNNQDTPEDPYNDDYDDNTYKGSGTDNTSLGKGIFDDTMGNSNNRSRNGLPLGADLQNLNIVDPEYEYQERNNADKQTNLADKGTVYPIIRINDHYFTEYEIQYFTLETGYYKNFYDYGNYKMPIKGFLPTMKLIVQSSNPDLLKQDFVKQGDRCSVFFTSQHSMIKSMRCDFRITNVVTSSMNQNIQIRFVKYIITGELYVPDLRNEEIRYNFNGSSRDAMMDAAKRLRLSFFFCDPEDTDDIMVWCNCKTPEMFIKDLTTHAWKNPNSFFESWIDPRYGLSFQNINKLLLEDGFDEPIDVTFWINTFINNRTIDGVDDNDGTKTTKPKPQGKILTNIPNDEESATVYHINKWRMINNAQEIQDYIGLNCKQQFEAVNPGLKDSPNYNVEFSLCINKTKFDPTKTPKDDKTFDPNPFYVLLGPGRNKTYANADDEMKTSETESSNKKEPEKVTNPQSDGDADTIVATDGNMLSSGNTHKFYEVAYEHNMRNLLQLQKQIIEVELNGANLTILRGEKIPMILIDNNKALSILHEGVDALQKSVTSCIYEAESGWFIIDGIEWLYNPELIDEGTGTCWRTNLKLTRREWPVPGHTTANDGQYADRDIVTVIDLSAKNPEDTKTKMAYQDYLRALQKNRFLKIKHGPQSKEQDAIDRSMSALDRTIAAIEAKKRGENVDDNFDGQMLPEIEVIGDITKSLDGQMLPEIEVIGDINKSNHKFLTYKDVIISDTDTTAELYNGSGRIQVNVGDMLLDIYDQYILNSDKVKNSTVPLTGLRAFMKELYHSIYEASDGNMKLVSARRWAVDQHGNKVNGNAFVKSNGYYKCMNAFGEVMYFKNNNSRHLYGEAIDIINYGDLSFNDLMTKIIMTNKDILTIMYLNGVSAYVEQAKDDTGTTTKHYHLGTDTIKQREFWASVKAILGTDMIPGTYINFTNYMKNNNKQETELTHDDIDETSILFSQNSESTQGD